MKKILSLFLTVLMVMCMVTTAFAVEGDTESTTPATYTITITDAADGATVAGHTYNVYQIYKGDLATDETGKTILSNVVYGQNYGTEGKEVPETELDALAAMTGEAAAAHLEAGIKNDPIAVLNDANGFSTAQVAGYYLIVDVTENLPEGSTTSAFILQVVEDVTVNSKHTAGPKVEKKIDDKNDSNATEDAIVWNDSADHDIGDKIPFQLKMTVPANFAQFVKYGEAYRFVFHDTEEKGLSFNNDAKVYVDGVEITEGFTVVSPATDGHTFDVVFADLTAIEGVKVGSVITVEYTSTLTEDAIIGSTGNVNEVYGEYRNIHYPETPKFTPTDTVIAFTYEVVVDKIDENEQPLDGATFTLEKFVASADGTETYKDVTGSWVAQDVVEAESGTTFTFTGLDDGEYRLTETETPAGYNTIDPIYFTVTAAHAIEWTNQARTDVLTSLTGNVVTGEIKLTASDDKGTLSTDVVNKSGTVLPETGGIGTTLFYIIGGLLALTAVVLLVTKKRMSSAE